MTASIVTRSVVTYPASTYLCCLRDAHHVTPFAANAIDQLADFALPKRPTHPSPSPGFNTGNVESAYVAYANGDITITDEFAPHHWVGRKAPQEWADAYKKHAQ